MVPPDASESLSDHRNCPGGTGLGSRFNLVKADIKPPRVHRKRMKSTDDSFILLSWMEYLCKMTWEEKGLIANVMSRLSVFICDFAKKERNKLYPSSARLSQMMHMSVKKHSKVVPLTRKGSHGLYSCRECIEPATLEVYYELDNVITMHRFCKNCFRRLEADNLQ